MKHVLLTAVATLIIGSVSLAQGQSVIHSTHKTHRPVTPKLEQMKVDLDLSDEQYNSLLAVNRSFAVERTRIAKDEQGRPLSSEMRKLKKEHHAHVIAVLTPEQRTKAVKLRKQRSAQRLEAEEHSPHSMHKAHK
ncbi:MAG: hypothetical protein RLP15_01725 [Cryomorphaceae bacterium]